MKYFNGVCDPPPNPVGGMPTTSEGKLPKAPFESPALPTSFIVCNYLDVLYDMTARAWNFDLLKLLIDKAPSYRVVIPHESVSGEDFKLAAYSASEEDRQHRVFAQDYDKLFRFYDPQTLDQELNMNNLAILFFNKMNWRIAEPTYANDKIRVCYDSGHKAWTYSLSSLKRPHQEQRPITITEIRQRLGLMVPGR